MAESSSTRSYKLLKIYDSEIEADRISSLPDSVIIDQILTRLSDTKLCISTGILSKRWEQLWKSVPDIYFDDFSFVKSAINTFGDFEYFDKAFLEFYTGVDNTVSQFQLHSINNFELDTNYDSRFESVVKNWIDFAVSKNVKKFKMHLRHVVDDDDLFLIDNEAFYTNSHFSKIDLGFCLLHPIGSISWNNLTNLRLSYSKLEEEVISKVVSGSPLLKTLTFQCCRGSLIDIRSSNVKNLIFIGHERDENLNSLTINGPNLCSLAIFGDLWISRIWLQDVSSLVKAEFNYQIPRYNGRQRRQEEEDMLNGLMLNLQHVKQLNIGVFCFSTLRRLVAKGFSFSSNLVAKGFSVEDVESGDDASEDLD